MKELTESDFRRAISGKLRRKLAAGRIDSGDDVIALRKFVGLSQVGFAAALGISVSTLRNWEQGRRHPVGPAMALLKVVSENPKAVLKALAA